MPKHRSIAVSLVDLGSIVEEFHYGPYSRFWWKMSTDKENATFFPLRIGQKTKTCLNSRDFFVTIVVGNKNNAFLPGDRELRAWQSMLRDVGSYNVTPWSNKESEYQFWTRSSQPEQDRATLQQLSKIGFLVSTPIHMPNKTKTFWNSFRRALDDNKQNSDGKRRVLSIIADEFSYSELETNLNVGRHTISESRKHARYVIDPGIRKELVNESQSLRRYLRKDFDKKLQIDDMGNAIHVSCVSHCLRHAFEAGEAKTSIDSHHAQITHAIKRYVKLGYDITSGENIEDVIKDLAGTHVAHIQPNRSQDRKSTLGYIYGRALPGFGSWNKFSPSKIQKIAKERIFVKPNPVITQHTRPNQPWITSSIKKKDDTEIVENDESSAETIDPTDPPSDTISKSYELFYKGWALKENQKIRSPVKRIVPEVKELLECMFHTGTVNPRQKMSAQEMRNELLRREHEGEISLDDIPKESTIANWITTFSRKWKQSMALRNMEEAENT
ncbi:unnamed protein product [Rhizophagus irregularis]|nr:unnamed protein product [Rhizophagus irregularis]